MGVRQDCKAQAAFQARLALLACRALQDQLAVPMAVRVVAAVVALMVLMEWTEKWHSLMAVMVQMVVMAA